MSFFRGVSFITLLWFLRKWKENSFEKEFDLSSKSQTHLESYLRAHRLITNRRVCDLRLNFFQSDGQVCVALNFWLTLEIHLCDQ